MIIDLASAKTVAVALMMAFGLSTATLAVTSIAAPTPAEAGLLKKAKKGLKVVGKGARFIEKKTAKMGKVGKVVSKGARGLRKGTAKASRGISKAQKGVSRAVGKVCRGTCGKVLKAGKKINSGIKKAQRELERKCSSVARNSRACRMASEAADLASPI